MNNHVPETEKYIKLFFFFLKDPPPTEIYPLPLHDALPIPRDRPDQPGHPQPARKARLAPPPRHRLEPRRRRQDGAAALPRALPVLRRRRPPLLPDVPEERRPLPRRAVQHRLVLAPHTNGGAGHRPQARRVCPYAGRRASLSESPRSSARAAQP